MSTKMELVTCHFIRTEYEEPFDRTNIPMALKYLIRNFSNSTIGSKILEMKEDLDFVKLLSSKLSNISFKLLYRASANKYLATKFHELCDGHAPTITIIQSNHGHIFGGYTKEKWTSIPQWVTDETTFIFLIRSNDSFQKCPMLFECKRNHTYAVWHDKDAGPVFDHNSIYIGDKCNELSSCWSCNYTKQQLTGGNNFEFAVVDYEVFELKFISK